MPAIDNDIYNRIPATWWKEDGFMALLRNAINPPRFRYFEHVLRSRLKLAPAGLRVLDVGCGGGLLSEQFAKLGCAVTGIDQSPPTLAAAREHARSGGLDICYVEGRAENLPFPAQQFDVVCCCDVLEHVDQVDDVMRDIARVLKPGGVFFFDTINRTWQSKLVAIKLMQDWPLTRFVPRNVHVWEKFIRPKELAHSMEDCGMPQAEFAGLAPSGNLFKAVLAFVRQRLGRINFSELGSRLEIGQSRTLSISYMGFALRSLRN
jgi:2-polyprenyl-6-hydroxyphenyl methylase / 3-demethylubiquinone-9 3-methyltransferase